MAARGSTKRLSVEQEDEVAVLYNGKRSASSGAADTDQGDVRTETELIECKYTGKPPKKILEEFEKIAQEAWSEGREPMLALRWHAPDSPLADARTGYVDLSVRRMCDDLDRYETARQDGFEEGKALFPCEP